MTRWHDTPDCRYYSSTAVHTVARRRDDGTNGSRMFSFILLFPRSNYGFIIYYTVFSVRV